MKFWPFSKSESAAAERVEPVLSVSNATPEPVTWEEFDRVFSSPPAFGSVRVTPELALQTSAVFACVGIISQTIATLPWKVMKRANGGDLAAPGHRVYRLLHTRPNAYQTSVVFREMLLNRALLNGEGFARIYMTRGGQLNSIEPLQNQSVEVKFEKRRLRYFVTESDGRRVEIPASRIIHIPHFVYGDTGGVETVSNTARNAIALASMLEEFSGRQLANGARPGGVITNKEGQTITPDGVRNLLKTFNENHQGVERNGKTFFLDGGLDYKQFEGSNVDAQHIESRREQVEEICRIFRVPPHMVSATSKSTSWGTGIEQQSLGFLKYTLRPIVTKIEQEFNGKCFATDDFYSEMSVEGLLRGDSNARSNFYQRMVGGPTMTPNEARRLEGLPDIEGGDELLSPVNMAPVDDRPETKDEKADV